MFLNDLFCPPSSPKSKESLCCPVALGLVSTLAAEPEFFLLVNNPRLIQEITSPALHLYELVSSQDVCLVPPWRLMSFRLVIICFGLTVALV